MWGTTACPAVKLYNGLLFGTIEGHDLDRASASAPYLIFIPAWVGRRPMANSIQNRERAAALRRRVSDLKKILFSRR